ncbi:hypothetical protein GCM10008090_12280 [Arenicella chitinivorans]|uniref:GTP cyclohydrolase II n=1 Tax=Arenicella chitinivorans TaxID=1329800 RepID=A0A918VKS7_9GAMM|nr:GTP cyclohydrolase II RibA [Arenicella chitinivorans]GHA04451.1 hypothetical protein GCM10008090_12280 [Arenicella chitinivorans]
MTSTVLNFQAETHLPTEFGTFRFRIYKNHLAQEVVAMISPLLDQDSAVPVRLHSACFTAEVMGSLKCDCKQQLDFALAHIAQHTGIVIYLPQEGRGIGLSNKIKAYALQESGSNTIEANSLLGLPVDDRSYEDAIAILQELGVQKIKLITNNPDKLTALRTAGFSVESRIPVPTVSNAHSVGYLETKREQMGHLLTDADLYHADQTQHPSNERPYVHLNFAMDARGRMHQADGQACDLSCESDWKRVHELRERYAAVVVGARTWTLDQPQLTARASRLGRRPQRQPDRVIFAGRTPCRVVPDARRSFVVGVAESPRTNCIRIKASNRELESPLNALYQQGVTSMLVEGGLTLLQSFIRQNMVDQMTIYVRTQSADAAQAMLSDQFPGLPTETMQASPLGQGVLLSYLPEHRYQTEAQTARSVASAAGAV